MLWDESTLATTNHCDRGIFSKEPFKGEGSTTTNKPFVEKRLANKVKQTIFIFGRTKKTTNIAPPFFSGEKHVRFFKKMVLLPPKKNPMLLPGESFTFATPKSLQRSQFQTKILSEGYLPMVIFLGGFKTTRKMRNKKYQKITGKILLSKLTTILVFSVGRKFFLIAEFFWGKMPICTNV